MVRSKSIITWDDEIDGGSGIDRRKTTDGIMPLGPG